MGPKKIKKLEIKKEVIANLDALAMSKIKGRAGYLPTDVTACNTCYACPDPTEVCINPQ